MKTIKLVLTLAFVLTISLMNAQNFMINTEESTIKWTGKKIGGKHFGEILIKSGTLEIKDNKIINAYFIIDMTSITNTDLESEEYKQKIVGHLKSDDFFGVENHPTSILRLSSEAEFINGIASVTADLTIKGKTNPVSFEIKKGENEYTSVIVIDRSKYDIRYGSRSFFDNLGDKYINDEFTLDVSLITE